MVAGEAEVLGQTRRDSPASVAWMPLRVRLVLAFFLPLLALAGVGLLALGQMSQATNRFARVADDNMARLNYIDGVSTALSQMRALELEHLVANDESRRVQTGEKLVTYRASLEANLADYEGQLRAGPRTTPFPLVRQRYATYVAKHDEIVARSGAGLRSEALALFDGSEELYQSLLADTRALRQQEAMAAQGAAHEGYTLGLHGRNTLVAGLLVAVGLVFAIGLWFSGYVQRRLSSVSMVIRRVAEGDFSSTVPVEGNDEFASLARSFNVMTDSLRESEEENAHLYAESLKLREERILLLQDALRRSVEVQENERHRIARELHDQVGQSLAILQLGLSRLQKLAPTPEAAEALSGVREMALEALREVREVSLDLRPGMLDDAGLVSTLREYAQQFAERTGIAVEVAAADWETRLQPEMEVTVFRIVQEALTNVAKHASAGRVRIGLNRTATTLEVSVRDDGAGFDIEEAMKKQRRKSLGLFGMEERCRLSDGRFEIDARPGQGTTVICSWDLQPVAVGGPEKG